MNKLCLSFYSQADFNVVMMMMMIIVASKFTLPSAIVEVLMFQIWKQQS